MPCSITTRSSTPDDVPRRRLRDRADELAWLLAPAYGLGFVGLVLGAAARWVAERAGVPAGGLPAGFALAGTAAGLGVSAWLAGRARRAARALAAERVEVLHVRGAPCMASTGDRAPVMLFDLGGSRCLLVAGEALADPSTFRDADGRASGGAIGPSAFPSSEFVLHRGIDSGRLIRIDLLGAPLAPVATVSSVVPMLRRRVRLRELRETLVLDVPFDDVARETA